VATGSLLAGASLAEFLAACAQGGGGTPTQTKLDIFSWWTSGGEADGLAEMFKIYTAKYPNVKIVNDAVAGGAGTNAKAELATRMQGGKPPDSFQVHAGQELTSTWVKAGKMEPITSIWQSEGWDSVIPKDLKTIVSSGSDVYSVPVNIHRGNALWLSAKAASSMTSTKNDLDTFLSALSTAQGAGMKAPLALGSKGNWQVTMWLENNIVAVGGADFYRGLFTGKSSWTDANV
jgi:glucose/mannose transport system substrate-binding protein